ncbi:hypothetical protein RvY_13100 [Ramazzottius varieornatus]|uniref:Uncharacterized protein n=1 Tax=Ramazzottius varieornatus TaxID=947166 RepID=A0A1D1VQT8_RAMVA|nr:hypothetical protein RvY_13100 [Ramazzottius varieornatus]
MQYFWVTCICLIGLVWFTRGANVVQKADSGPRRAIEKPEIPHESQKPAQAAQRRPKKVRPTTPVPTTTPTTTTTLSEVEIHARAPGSAVPVKKIPAVTYAAARTTVKSEDVDAALVYGPRIMMLERLK